MTFLLLLLSSSAFAGVNFDGSNDKLTTGSDLGINAFPISFYIVCRRDTDALTYFFFLGDASDANRYFALVNDGTNWQYHLRNDTGSPGAGWSVASFADYDDANWHKFVCVSSAANNHRLYVDGELKATNTDSTNWNSENDVTGVGGIFDSSPTYGDCTVAEFAVWDTDLSATEAIALTSMNVKRAPLQVSPAELQLLWTLDDQAHNDTANSANGLTFRDNSANENTGTASGCNAQAEEILSYP